VKSFGRLDGMVISHGVLNPQKLDNASLEDIRYVYEVNYFSCLALVHYSLLYEVNLRLLTKQQAKAGLKDLRRSKGCIIWMSSGAAVSPYLAWGAYCSTKAATNLTSSTMALEEADIISIAVAPGKVDTEMQQVIRSEGKDVMDKAKYDEFVELFQTSRLLRPEQPGTVIAKLVAEPQKELSGKFVK
jgi:NAD(P)-dependent dehydrogenase (short-subunit alcohol dehydrogenase family)